MCSGTAKSSLSTVLISVKLFANGSAVTDDILHIRSDRRRSSMEAESTVTRERLRTGFGLFCSVWNVKVCLD